MQVFKYTVENLNCDVLRGSGIHMDDVLYFDIETTGLSRDRNQIYLIGCGYYECKCDGNAHDACMNIIQWFADDISEEKHIIQAFADFISSYSSFINYNGKSFDLPFILARAKKYNISLNLDDFRNIDLYTYVKPYKKLLGLNDLKQKTLELFLKIRREDLYSGEELIRVYKKYASRHKAADDLSKLLLHNMEDVKNMHYLLPLLKLEKLGGIEASYVNHDLCEYSGYSPEDNIYIRSSNDKDKNKDIDTDMNICVDINFDDVVNTKRISYELIINCSHNLNLDLSFTSILNIDSGTYALNYTKDRLVLRIPVKCETLSYYFENYKDYYYLPKENMCILKSIASGVAKEDRENATKENCKVSYAGKFIYAFNSGEKRFKSTHNSKFEYIRLDDFNALPDNSKTAYINSMLKSFL